MYKMWKQPKCPPTDDWIKMWHRNTMEYYSTRKEGKLAICSNMDGLGGYWGCTKGKKPDGGRQILYDITETWNLRNTTN